MWPLYSPFNCFLRSSFRLCSCVLLRSNCLLKWESLSSLCLVLRWKRSTGRHRAAYADGGSHGVSLSLLRSLSLCPCQNPPTVIETRGQKAAEHCGPLAHVVSLANWKWLCSLLQLTYAPAVLLLPLLLLSLSLLPALPRDDPPSFLPSLSALDRADLGTSPVFFGLWRQI